MLFGGAGVWNGCGVEREQASGDYVCVGDVGMLVIDQVWPILLAIKVWFLVGGDGIGYGCGYSCGRGCGSEREHKSGKYTRKSFLQELYSQIQTGRIMIRFLQT